MLESDNVIQDSNAPRWRLRDLHPHDLRRTAASWAVQAGASLAVVAASLGHRDTRITEQHYGHLSDDPVRRMLSDNAGRLLATVPAVVRGEDKSTDQSGPIPLPIMDDEREGG
jgi:hypothetical protein